MEGGYFLPMLVSTDLRPKYQHYGLRWWGGQGFIQQGQQDVSRWPYI